MPAELVPAETIEHLAHAALPGTMRLAGDVVTLIDQTGRPKAAVIGSYEARASSYWLVWPEN